MENNNTLFYSKSVTNFDYLLVLHRLTLLCMEMGNNWINDWIKYIELVMFYFNYCLISLLLFKSMLSIWWATPNRPSLTLSLLSFLKSTLHYAVKEEFLFYTQLLLKQSFCGSYNYSLLQLVYVHLWNIFRSRVKCIVNSTCCTVQLVKNIVQ